MNHNALSGIITHSYPAKTEQFFANRLRKNKALHYFF